MALVTSGHAHSGVSVSFTAIYGTNGGGPVASLLTIDGTRILLDCGWTDAFDPAVVEPLRALAPTLDMVLLSHSDLEHAGALPLLLAKWKSPALVFSTLPVNRLGQMFLYDAFLSRSGGEEGFTAFSLDDVDAAFRLINVPGGRYDLLRFSEERTLKGVTFAPLPSGRSLGGSLWRISKGPEMILYAVGFNHRTERHLGKAAALSLASLQRRPTVMITDSANGLSIHPAPSPLPWPAVPAPKAASGDAGGEKTSTRDAADRELVDTMLATLRRGGNVLVPTDTASRSLELLLRIEAAWPEPHSAHAMAAASAGQQEGVHPMMQGDVDFPVVLLNHVSGRACTH